MKRYFLIAMLLSLNAQAETFVCVAEAGAYVEHTESDNIKSGVYSASSTQKLKLLLHDENGDWQVKRLGEDIVLFECETEYFCMDRPDGFAGVFIRGNDGVFTVTGITVHSANLKTSEYYVMKGRCSKL